MRTKKLTVNEIKYLNKHFGNGYFFSRGTMSFFKDKIKDFATYLNDQGETILYHKIRKSEWLFNPNDNSLRTYRIKIYEEKLK